MGWTARVVLSVAASIGLATAQYPTGHATGIVIPAKFGSDDQEDFLVFDGRIFHAWQGQEGYPYFKRGPTTATYFDRTLGSPLVVGRHLFVPLLGSAYTPRARIQVFEIGADGSLKDVGGFSISPDLLDGIVHSLRLVALPWDEGADGVPDVLAVWAETPVVKYVSMRCAILDWIRIREAEDLPPLSRQPATLTVASLHQSRHLAQPEDEFLMVLSNRPLPGRDHLGIVTLGRVRGEFKIKAESWFGGAPSTRHPGWAGAWSPVAYGRFSPTPVFAVPAVTVLTGPTAVFHAQLSAPYVARQGRAVDTSRLGFMLDSAVADFDGDGAEEVVFVEPNLPGFGACAVVTDPHPQERATQFFRLGVGAAVRDGSATKVSVPFHGAAVDLNGDGRKDLVMSVTAQQRGGLVLMLAKPWSTENGAGLYRVH